MLIFLDAKLNGLTAVATQRFDHFSLQTFKMPWSNITGFSITTKHTEVLKFTLKIINVKGDRQSR